MRAAVRLAVRMALSSDPRQRWRQVSVVVSALIAVMCLALSAVIVAASAEVERTLSLRAPLGGEFGEPATLLLTPRGIVLDGHQVSIMWLDRADGVAEEQIAVPPGLTRIPEPGEAVVSPGLAALGVTAESLGFDSSTAGAGQDGVIGPEGVGTQDELRFYARPAPGRSLDTDNAFEVSRYPTQADLALLGHRDESGIDYPLPRLGEMRTLALILIVIPALTMLGLGTRARSEVRTKRSEFLLRLGVGRATVRGILAIEGALLGGVGAVIGAAVYAGMGPLLTTIPLSGTRFVPGALAAAPSVLIAAAVIVMVVVSFVSCVTRLTTSTRRRPARRMGILRALPFGLGAICILATGALAADGTQIFYLGVVLLAVGLPLIAPWIARMVANQWRKGAESHSWLAASRVVYAPLRTSRVAALLALAVYLGATSVAVYHGPMTAAGADDQSSNNAPAAFVVDWIDEEPGDFESFRDRLSAEYPDAVALPVGRASEDADVVQTVFVADCAQLEPVESAIGASACDESGTLSAEAESVLTTVFHQAVTTGSVAETALTDTKDDGTAKVWGALVLGTGSIDPVALYRAGAPLPAFNPNDLIQRAPVVTALTGWMAAGWLIAVLILTLAILRELIEYSRAVHRDGIVLARIGLSDTEAERVGRWTLLIPVFAIVPVSYVSGLVTSFVGMGPQITKYTPVWISSYTALTLAITVLAIFIGLILARGSRRARR